MLLTNMLDPPTVSFHSANGKHLASRCLDSKVHGTNMGPIWGRQDPGGPHVVPMNLLSGGAVQGTGTYLSQSQYYTFAMPQPTYVTMI